MIYEINLLRFWFSQAMRLQTRLYGWNIFLFDPECSWNFQPEILPRWKAPLDTQTSLDSPPPLPPGRGGGGGVRTDLTGADPGFFLGGGALVSWSTSTPINHIVYFCRILVVLENRRSSQGGGVRTPCTLPLDPPLFNQLLALIPLVVLSTKTDH